LSEALHLKNYLDRRFGKEDALLHAIRSEAAMRGLPPIQIPIHVGRFLQFMVKVQQAERVLEIGSLAGYSTVWLARALPPLGQMIALEVNPDYIALAEENILKAGLTAKVEFRQGNGVDQLAKMALKPEAPFDFIFIDANKSDNSLYLEWALHFSRPGTLIVIDNIIAKGERAGFPDHDEAEEVYKFNDFIAGHPAFELASIPTIAGETGRLDGLALLRVN
jgi:predicted O-methyltransferase YrrM